jgi:hypothetical protein
MNIAPVKGSPLAKTEQAANERVRSGSAQAGSKSVSAEAAIQPVSGALPKQKNTVAKNVPVTYELPEDVVEMHQDPEIKDQIIIQYLDQSKNVILQVPSSEELSVERGIAQESQTAAKLRAIEAAAAAGSEGDKTHGNQL